MTHFSSTSVKMVMAKGPFLCPNFSVFFSPLHFHTNSTLNFRILNLMLWWRRCPFICYSQIASFSSWNSSGQNYNYHFISLLDRFPDSRHVTFQIHAKLTTSGSFYLYKNSLLILVFNTLLRRYALGESPRQALYLYKQAQEFPLCFYFDSFTYSILIKVCATLKLQFEGIQFHSLVVALGFGRHVYVQTAIINMYIDFGLLCEAKKVFEEMPEKNLVTWNVIVTGFAKQGHIAAALDLFWAMPERNIVSWTGVIDGCIKMKKQLKAFSLFRTMIIVGGIMPSDVTFLTIFPAIAEFGDLKNCQSVHAYGHKAGFNAREIEFTNSLIDTYAKCGCITSALKVFNETLESRKNIVSWTSIICGFALHGMGKEAAKSLERMTSLGFNPNRVTLLGILTACSHGGLIEEGLQFFRKMTNDCQLVPDIKHYGCLIDMLGRAGKLKEAEEIAQEIPNHIENAIIWRTLLGACSLHGDPEMAERVARKIHEMEKGYGGDYVLMSNVLTGHGKFIEAENFRALMNERSVRKNPGQSS